MLALIFSGVCFAKQSEPLYAIFEFTSTGPKGTVRAVELVIVDGDRRACESTLAGLKSGHFNRVKEAGTEDSNSYGRDGCFTTLPAEFKAVSNEVGLEGAYYVSRKLQLADATDQFISILYGLDDTDPNSTCLQLIRSYALQKKFSDLKCVGPARHFQNLVY